MEKTSVINVSISLMLILSTWISQIAANCRSDQIPDFALYDNAAIEPNFVGTVAVFTMENTLSATIEANSIYLGITFANNVLTVSTLPAFANYERDEIRLDFSVRIALACADESYPTLFLRQSIHQRNNHAPEFSQVSYEHMLPLPLPSNILLSQLLDLQFFTIDLDLGTQNTVTYRIEGTSIFDVTSVRDATNLKRWNAMLRTNQAVMKLPEPLVFKLIATDNGVPETKSAETTITLTSNPEELPKDPPHFEQVLYKGTLSSDGQLTIADIVLVKESYNSDVTYALEGDDKEYFSIQHVENIVTLTLSKPVPPEIIAQSVFLSCWIESKSSVSFGGSTAIIIDLPQVVTVQQMRFENSLYSGNLNKDKQLVINDIVLEENNYDDTVEFTLGGVDMQYFTITNESNVVKLTLGNNIPEEVWFTKSFFSLVLTAVKVEDNSAATAVIIENANFQTFLKFEKSLYNGDLMLDSNLTLENLVITIDTFVAGITIELVGEHKDWFIATLTNNLVTITTIESIPVVSLEGLNMIFLNVVANRAGLSSATTVISISVEQKETIIISSPRFEKSLYVGEINELRQLVLEEIRIVPETNGDDVILQLIGDDSEIFTFDNVNGVITLKLSTALTDEDLAGRTLFELLLEASRLGAPATQTGIVLDLPLGSIKVLRFEKSLYRGNINLNSDLALDENVILVSEIYDPDVTFTITNDPTDIFEISHQDNTVSVRLVRPLTAEEFANWGPLSFNIEAQLAGALTGITAVTIEILHRTLNVPTFEKQLYRGSVSDELTLSLENLNIMPATYSPDVELTLSDSYSLFKFTDQSGVITIETQRSLIEEDFEGRSYFHLEMVAKRSEAEQSTTGILIDVPTKSCDIPPNDQPYFEYENHHLVIKDDITGMIGVVRAKLDDLTGQLQYALEITNEYLNSNIQIDALRGEIMLTNALIADNYEFKVVATNLVNSKYAKSNVLLTVDAEKQCPGEKFTTVTKSLMIEYLDENSNHDIMSAKIDDCEYEILYVEPNNTQYFSIDQTEKRLMATAFDREHTMFQGYAVPQFQIKLRLNCPDTPQIKQASLAEQMFDDFSYLGIESSNLQISPVDPTGKYLVSTHEVFYSTHVTTLNVIIKDLNDNAPQFTSPKATGTYVLGYPNLEIAEKILPPYLFKVEAEDIDEGEHAKIQFSLKENDHFEINPITGVIYPLSNALENQNEVTIEVEARDMDGKTIGSLAATQMMKVKRLESEHLLVLQIADEKLENIPTIVDFIKAQSNLEVRVLSQAVIPTRSNLVERLLRKLWTPRADGEARTVLRLITYALNFEDELQNSEATGITLESLGGSYKISTLPVDQLIIEPECGITKKDSKAALIAGVSVLGALLLLTLVVGGILLYIYKIRPYLQNRQTENSVSSSQANLANDFESTPPSSSPTHKRSSVFIEGTTLQESESDRTTKLSKSLGTMLEDEGSFYENESVGHKNVMVETPENSKDKGKSIKFNEVVERIEVVEEVADDDESVKL